MFVCERGWSASRAVRLREPQMQYSLLSLKYYFSTTAGEAAQFKPLPHRGSPPPRVPPPRVRAHSLNESALAIEIYCSAFAFESRNT